MYLSRIRSVVKYLRDTIISSGGRALQPVVASSSGCSFPYFINYKLLYTCNLASASISSLAVIQNGMESSGSLHSIPEGTSVTLKCTFRGRPAPNVEWYRDGVLVTENINSNLSQSYLEVTNVQSSHSYQCGATNQYGSHMASVLICSMPSGKPAHMCQSAPIQPPPPSWRV